MKFWVSKEHLEKAFKDEHNIPQWIKLRKYKPNLSSEGETPIEIEIMLVSKEEAIKSDTKQINSPEETKK